MGEQKEEEMVAMNWAIIELGSPGIISEVDIDTSFFTGKFSSFCFN